MALYKSVYDDISLTCHFWKADYMRLFPAVWPGRSERKQYLDVWEEFEKEPKPDYTLENWTCFLRASERS